MKLLTILLFIAVFLSAASLVLVAYGIWSEGRFAEKRTIKKRLLFLSAGGRHGQEKLARYRDMTLKEVGAFEQLMLKLPRLAALDRMLVKSKFPLNASAFILFSLALGLLGFLAGFHFLPRFSGAVVAGMIALILPYLFLKISERAYYTKFQEQLPEALDLLARAMRSGHALTSGLDMIAQETVDPLRTEFSATVDEIKLGLTVQEAFDNLCERVPSTDLRFFAIAVTIQKETGGNLAEILDNISRLIRERVKFARQLKALTAEGRLSAWVLIALPLVMFVYIYLVNYEYISILWREKAGVILLCGGIGMQVIGALVMKRIVSIKL